MSDTRPSSGASPTVAATVAATEAATEAVTGARQRQDSTEVLADEAPNYLPHRQILIVMTGVMTGMFLAALDQSIVGTALPSITSDLGGLDHLSWVVTAYLLTSTASTPLWGKISDLYGRRLIFQAAIVIFLIGSLASGAAQDMTQLIGARALQGLGGGGLFALALAIIGDVVPPRERGRYQGFFGAVFGTSSVAGPLLGGWLTEGPGWRWIFLINIPLGLASLVVTSRALKIPTVRRSHSIDYLGATLVVGAVTCMLLFLSWAGTNYGWTAPLSLALLGASIMFAIAFVLVERRVAEPIIPMHLFSGAVFRWSVVYSAVMGLAMFGGIIFLPIYFQVVQGMSPTESGLALLPMVLGLFTASITSGHAISRTGRYRIFPIVGAVVTGAGLLMLSRLQVDTPYWQIAIATLVLGAGLGLTMQTLVVATQNSVAVRDLGTATSSLTFFRSMGAAVGVAAFGAVLNSRLAHYLEQAFGSAIAAVDTSAIDVTSADAIRQLPAEVQSVVLDSFVQAMQDVFLSALPFVLIAFVVAFLIPDIRLRERSDTAPAPVAME